MIVGWAGWNTFTYQNRYNYCECTLTKQLSLVTIEMDYWKFEPIALDIATRPCFSHHLHLPSCHLECWMQVKKMDQNGYSRDCVNKGISSFVPGSYYMYNKCVKNFLVKYKFLFCGRQIATLPNSPHHDPSYIIFFPSRGSVFIFCLSWDLSCGQNLLKRMHVWS